MREPKRTTPGQNRHIAIARHAVLACALAVATIGCPHARGGEATSEAPTALPASRPIAQIVYDGALKGGWQDSGWSPHDIGHGPAQIDFSHDGGWMISNPTLHGSFGGLELRVKAPEGEAEFLELRLDSNDKTIFPRIQVRADQKADLGDGWEEVFVPIDELDPKNVPFDRIVLRAFRRMPAKTVLIDKIALVAAGPDGGVPPPSNMPVANATMRVDCRARPKAISPLIYGIAWKEQETEPPNVPATTRRWGGNPTTTYNWQIGNAWNTGNDWFFENVAIKPVSQFFSENQQLHMVSALTVPILGWVAKDTTSSSFPVSVYGNQQYTDGYRKDAGNGVKPNGKPIVDTSPERTSIRITPDFDAKWLESLASRGHAPGIVILDNEPGIWNETHRDIHPEPTTYDELLQKSIAYATAVRRAAPNAKIAGPAEWGWSGYMYSAKDKAAGFSLHPDRRAHGDEPMIPWWLKQMKIESDKTGVRLLDMLDLHFYPQAQNVYSDAADSKTAALRIRQVRGLWDKDYVDESWIAQPIALLPRMRDWIAQTYPGLGIMIGEWSFGGEKHMSGGLATAEALGVFGQQGVEAAYYWTVPPNGSPAAEAFSAYRNYDGRGGHFEDWSLPTRASLDTALFASRDKAGKHVVLVALNFSPDAAVAASVDTSSCGAASSVSARTYQGGSGFVSEQASTSGSGVSLTLPAYSITVIDLSLAAPIGVSAE